MKKQRFQYGVGGYRWAPESFHVLKGLPGQKKKEVPMTREERQEVGYRFITKGFRAAVAHVKHIERARVHKKQSHITYGFRLMGERGYLCCQELSCPADAPLAMRLSLFKMIREDLKRRACQVEISTECELDGAYRPVNIKTNTVTADLSRPLTVRLISA